jgi:hypothetical protein
MFSYILCMILGLLLVCAVALLGYTDGFDNSKVTTKEILTFSVGKGK